MNVLWAYALLRLLADALRAGDARTAGQELDRELDGVARWFANLLRGACGCYLAWCLVCLAWAVVAIMYDLIGYWLRGR